MAVASPQVELLISLFFSEDDMNFSYVSYISTSGITTLHTQDIFLEKIKKHANNLIGDHVSKISPPAAASIIIWNCKARFHYILAVVVAREKRYQCMHALSVSESQTCRTISANLIGSCGIVQLLHVLTYSLCRGEHGV